MRIPNPTAVQIDTPSRQQDETFMKHGDDKLCAFCSAVLQQGRHLDRFSDRARAAFIKLVNDPKVDIRSTVWSKDLLRSDRLGLLATEKVCGRLCGDEENDMERVSLRLATS